MTHQSLQLHSPATRGGLITDAAIASPLEAGRQSAREIAVRAAELRRTLSIAGAICLVLLVIWSAILAKTTTISLPLASVRIEQLTGTSPAPTPVEVVETSYLHVSATSSRVLKPIVETSAAPVPLDILATDPQIRWFNGRPARPVRSVWMRVTGYSPDARSCGTSADGLTATMHSVETNGFRLAAADPTVLAYGSMISIQGYDAGQIVPVLDCGGAIKGQRLDLLFRTHEEALKWGVKDVRVLIWSYADGQPAENPRSAR